ncbi:MAG: GWxTD domain-containing protein [Ignavibacteriales bacterium]|nr:GWxTD domain-containing protein [Ignavibacteriales bacterium]
MKSNVWVLVLAVLAGSLSAQERIDPRSSFVINFDLARFKNNDSTQYVEMYFASFPHLVTLERAGAGFRGFVEIRLKLRDKETGVLALDNRSLVPVDVPDTSGEAYRTTLIAQLGYVVPAGSYDLHVNAIDSLASARQDSFTVNFDVVPQTGSFGISDVELCSNIRRSTNQDDPFYKNLHEVVPNPTLLFGAANHPVIFHYLELYNLNKDETYTIKTILADGGGNPLQEATRKRKFGVENAVDVGTTNATKLPSGKYRFQVIVLSSAAEPLLRTEKRFYAYNPQAVVAIPSDAEMVETELSGLTSEELALEFETARYLATQEEVGAFSKITSLQGRREFLAKFWSDVAKGKMGYDPIVRRDYLMRVKRANERYRAMSRDGWRTDRGRVFVLYAEPDEIDRRPSSEGGKPHEIWSYYRIENGVMFVFIDRMGFGDYTLVHSTKRGELRDDDWERLLQ